MGTTRIVRIRENILRENETQAASLAARLTDAGLQMVNIMASPGGGKTSLIHRTIQALDEDYRMAVIEADIDSTVDADTFTAVDIPAVQIETGGFCHVDAAMTLAALHELGAGVLPADLDLVFLENVGNLICTAQNPTGAHVNIAVLSVPEGDDKPLKYPLMFRAADAVVINKIDYLELAEFDLLAVSERIRVLNPDAPVFALSCRTGEGVETWTAWLHRRLARDT